MAAPIVKASRKPSLARILRVACILFFAILSALLAGAARWTFDEAMKTAERSTAELTRTAESQLTRILEQADLLLLEQRDIALATDWNDARAAAAVGERLAQRSHVLPYVFRLFIIGADGIPLAGSFAAEQQSINAAERDYFISQRQADRGLIISTPLRSIASGEPIIVFSRRVSGREGEFRGVVVVSFNLDTLATFMRSLPSKYPSVTQLIGSDMQLLVSAPEIGSPASDGLKDSFQALMRNDASGVATYASRDGVERIWAFRTLTPYPLYVRAGIARADVVDGWLNQTLPYFAFAALAFSILAGLSIFAVKRAHNEEHFRALLVDMNARLEDRVNERTETLEETNRQLNAAITSLGDKSRTLEALNRINSSIAAEFGLERLVQTVTDAATEIVGADFGAFFYNVNDATAESYSLYALSGAPREAFAKFPMPRNTAVFHPTFRGQGTVRSDDITTDPRYGRNPPFEGMPEGHLPVRSYLAVPVISREGDVIGGLFFGHSEPGIFSDQAEEIIGAIAAQAAIAYNKAQLFRAAEMEIARRTDTERALRASETRFRQLADSMPQIVWTARPDGWPDYYNSKWYEYTGLPRTKLHRWNAVLHPEDRSRTIGAWLDSIRSGEICQVEYRLKNRDGEYRWHLARGLPVSGSDGKIVQWLATCTDVDDLKRAETDLAHHRDELASQANRLSQALDDREVLFKEVHHRVKNNLQVICSLVRMQASRISDRNAKSALEDTYNRIFSIGLVHEVLYGDQEASELDVGVYLNRLCATLDRVYGAAERGVSIGVTASGSLDLVRAVPVGLLVNELVSNALKHGFPDGREGSVVLTFSSQEEYVLFVGDDGVGMPVGFDEPRAGSLGLTIIKALVQQLGATMELEPGAGTNYRIAFPSAS